MSEKLLEQILEEQKATNRALSEIKTILSLSVMQNGHPSFANLKTNLKHMAGLEAAKTVYLENETEAYRLGWDMRAFEFQDDWAMQGWTICMDMWRKMAPATSDKHNFMDEICSGKPQEMSRVKSEFYVHFKAPKNATDLNKKLISKVRYYIQKGQLPSEGVFKRIKNSRTTPTGRTFPSKAKLTKVEIYKLAMVYYLTWGFRSQSEAK